MVEMMAERIKRGCFLLDAGFLLGADVRMMRQYLVDAGAKKVH